MATRCVSGRTWMVMEWGTRHISRCFSFWWGGSVTLCWSGLLSIKCLWSLLVCRGRNFKVAPRPNLDFISRVANNEDTEVKKYLSMSAFQWTQQKLDLWIFKTVYHHLKHLCIPLKKGIDHVLPWDEKKELWSIARTIKLMHLTRIDFYQNRIKNGVWCKVLCRALIWWWSFTV